MSISPSAGSPGPASQVELRVPADPHALRLLRLAAADAGATAGFTTDRIDRLRIAVDELAALLIAESDAPLLTVVMTRSESSVEVDGSIASDGTLPEIDDLVVEVLNGCTTGDSWRVWVEDGQLQFRLGVQKE